MAWSAETLQFVIFTQPSVAPVDAFQIWIELFTTTPDGYQKHPDPMAMASNATGTYAGYNFAVTCNPGRIDLVLQGAAAPFPEIANLEAATTLLKDRSLILSGKRQGVRFALVAQLFENMKSLAAANEAFAQKTTLNNLPKSATDLTFAINLTKQLGGTGININRICRWNSVVKQVMQVQFGNLVPTQGPSQEQAALMLNLDVNTILRAGSIPGEKSSQVIEGLFAEYRSIMEGGYGELVR